MQFLICMRVSVARARKRQAPPEKTDLAVRRNDAALLVAAGEHELLLGARVELVEAGEDVREVHDRPADLVDLVEDVISEELDDVTVASLRPPRLMVVPECSSRIDTRKITIIGTRTRDAH